MKKEEAYKRIKIAGAISFIPITLVVGPFSGYFLGDYLEKRFGFSSYALYIFIGLGFIVSIVEVFRIIKAIIKMDK